MFPSYRNQSIDLLWKDDGKIGPLNPTLNKVTEEINSKSKKEIIQEVRNVTHNKNMRPKIFKSF